MLPIGYILDFEGWIVEEDVSSPDCFPGQIGAYSHMGVPLLIRLCGNPNRVLTVLYKYWITLLYHRHSTSYWKISLICLVMLATAYVSRLLLWLCSHQLTKFFSKLAIVTIWLL
jgi:hypothetical protein